MKKFSFLLALLGVGIGIAASVRIGALSIAAAIAFFVVPDFKSMRAIEKIIPLALIVSLITIALALPRR